MQKIKRNILIAHGNVEMRDIFIKVLGHEDFQLFIAATAVEILEIIEKKRIELVFMDRFIPGEDGIDVLVKAKKINPLVKIIMLSGEPDRFARAKIINMGAFGYLSKPFQLGNVLTMAESALDVRLIKRSISPIEELDNKNIFEKAFSYTILEKDRRRHILMQVLSIVGGIIILAGLFGIYYQRSDKMYHTPYSNPTALAWSGKSMWVSDWVTQSFYEHAEEKNFNVNTVYYVQNSNPTGLAWDGKTLWSCNAWEKKIYMHRMDSSFSVVQEFDSPGPYPTGLYFDAMYLWICDSKSARIYKTKIQKGKLVVLNEYHAPGLEPVGMFSDGYNLWSADARTGLLYKHMYDNQLTVASVYKIKQYDTGRDRLTGMTWDGEHIWTCSEGSQKLYRHLFHNLVQQKI